MKTPMFLSVNNENLLKMIINSKDKKKELEKLNIKMNIRQKEITNDFDQQLLDIVSKIENLEKLNSELEHINKKCNEITDKIKEYHIKKVSIYEDYSQLTTALQRLGYIKHEISEIYEYMKNVGRISQINDIYEFVKILKILEVSKNRFKTYDFYFLLNKFYLNNKKKIIKDFEKKIILYFKDKNFVNIGKKFKDNILEHDKPTLFHKIIRIKRELVDTDFLKLIYASNQLEIKNKILFKINQECKNMIIREKGQAEKNKEIIYLFMSIIIFDNCLNQYFEINLNNYNYLIEMLDKNQINDPETIILLKKIIIEYNIDNEKLNTLIENTIYNYLNSEISKDNLFKNILHFIDNTIKFIEKMHEIDCDIEENIIARKVDSLLLENLENKSNKEKSANSLKDVFLETEHVLEVLKTKFCSCPTFNFTVNKKMDAIGFDLIETECDSLKKICSTENIENIVKKIIELKNFFTEKYRMILARKILSNYKTWISSITEDDSFLITDTIKRNFNLD